MYHIKREAWFGDEKLNKVNCRSLMDQYEVIMYNIRDIFINMNEGTVTEDKINIFCDKYKWILNEMDQGYRCMRLLCH